jgi:putative flippase GtrA
VTTAGHVGDRYLVAKVAVVAGSTLWNFLLYRHWVFTPTHPRHEEAPMPTREFPT